MATTAIEMITSRLSNTAAAAIARYQAVAIAADGRYTVAEDATLPFIGICQYGADAAGDVATVVRGIFPGEASAAIEEGDPVKPTTDGKFVTVSSGAAVGIALNAASAAGELVSIQILDTPFTVV